MPFGVIYTSLFDVSLVSDYLGFSYERQYFYNRCDAE